MLSDAELKELADDIKAHGLRVPVVLHEDQILEGRNRYRACELAKVKPTYSQYEGDGSLDALISFVRSMNLHRRHDTAEQRALAGAKLVKIYEADAKARSKENLKSPDVSRVAHGAQLGESAKRAAEATGASVGSIRRAGKVLDTGSQELLKAVEAGTIPVTTAAKLATAPKAEQTAAVKAGPAAVKEAARKATEAKPKPSKGKEKVSAAKLCDAFLKAYGRNLTRDLDAIAEVNGGKGKVHYKGSKGLDLLFEAVKEMRGGAR